MECLGTLDYSQKCDLWTTTISGSKVKKLYNDYETWELWRQFKGLKEWDILSAEAERKTNFGKIVESVIIQHARDLGKLKLIKTKDIKTDKRTFKFNEYETGNIDGYIGESIDNIDYIVEVKWSQLDKSSIVSWYKSQCMYYANRFNAKYGTILIYMDINSNIEVLLFERNKKYEDDMDFRIKKFIRALETNEEPKAFWLDGVQNIDELKCDEDKKNRFLSSLEAIWFCDEEIRRLKAKRDKIYKYWKTRFEQCYIGDDIVSLKNFPYEFPYSSISIVKTQRKKIDEEKLKMFFQQSPSPYSIDDFYTETTSSPSWRFNKKSIKKLDEKYINSSYEKKIQHIQNAVAYVQEAIKYDQEETRRYNLSQIK